MNAPDHYFDDFKEDLNDPVCVQQIYDFALLQVRGLVEYNDEADVIQEVFYRLTKWPIGEKYNSKRHYFSMLKITIRQAVAAYWKRRHSQRNDIRKRKFISELQTDAYSYEPNSNTKAVWMGLHIKELVKLILERARSLSHRQQAMFQLRFLEQKSHEEIALELEISIRTSYRLESQVREILQAIARVE